MYLKWYDSYTHIALFLIAHRPIWSIAFNIWQNFNIYYSNYFSIVTCNTVLTIRHDTFSSCITRLPESTHKSFPLSLLHIDSFLIVFCRHHVSCRSSIEIWNSWKHCSSDFKWMNQSVRLEMNFITVVLPHLNIFLFNNLLLLI